MSVSKWPLSQIGWASRVVVLLVGLAWLREQTAAVSNLPFVEGDLWRNLILISAYWVTMLAPGFYLVAAWCAGSVFLRLDKGTAFGPTVVRGLREIGGNLIAGALTAIVFAPTVLPIIEDRFRGVRYDFEIEPVTIGLIGLLLWLITAAGEKLQSEMESFV